MALRWLRWSACAGVLLALIGCGDAGDSGTAVQGDGGAPQSGSGAGGQAGRTAHAGSMGDGGEPPLPIATGGAAGSGTVPKGGASNEGGASHEGGANNQAGVASEGGASSEGGAAPEGGASSEGGAGGEPAVLEVTLRSFAPVSSFCVQGQQAPATTPVPLEVTLSAPALQDTFIPIASGAPASLGVVGGGVTVLAGQQSAIVHVVPINQATVVLTASLNAQELTASVEVLSATAAPRLFGVTPSAISLPAGGSQTFQVLLDIAAPPGGTSIALEGSPVDLGTLPAMVTIPAGEVSASFEFVAASGYGSVTITATLGADHATAMLSIAQASHIVINEVDYDQPGGDAQEFIELFNPSSETVDLGNLALVLVNGFDKAEYKRIALSGSLPGGNYLVVGSASLLAGITNAIKVAFTFPTNNVQDGAPDGIALVDIATHSLVDALAYEGVLNDAVIGGLTGTVSLVEGAPFAGLDDSADELSLIRSPNGNDTNQASHDWKTSASPSPGRSND